jgi:hypothetical protein
MSNAAIKFTSVRNASKVDAGTVKIAALISSALAGK